MSAVSLKNCSFHISLPICSVLMHRKNMGNYETGCTICTQCSWFIAQYKASYTAFSLNLTKKPIFLFTEKMLFINRCIISKLKLPIFLYYIILVDIMFYCGWRSHLKNLIFPYFPEYFLLFYFSTLFLVLGSSHSPFRHSSSIFQIKLS